MTRLTFAGGFYTVALPNGTSVVEYADRIETAFGRLDRPAGGLGAIVAIFREGGRLYIAGQGHDDGQCWLYDGTWKSLGPTHGVRPCAFGSDALYWSVSGNTYKRLELQTGEVTTHPLNIGSQGIRFVRGDVPVPGDATLFDGTVHEFIDRGDVRVGQGHEGGCLLNGRLLEPGDCQFIQFERAGDQLAVAIVKFLEGQSVCHWLSRSEVYQLPLPTVPIPGTPVPNPGIPPKPEPVPMPDPKDELWPILQAVNADPAYALGLEPTAEATKARSLRFLAEVIRRARAKGLTAWALLKKPSGLNADNVTHREDVGIRHFDVISGADGVDKDGSVTYAPRLTWGDNGLIHSDWEQAFPDDSEPPAEPPKPEQPPSTDVADLQAAIKSLLYSLARQDEQVTNLTRRVTNLEQRPTNLTLPELAIVIDHDPQSDTPNLGTSKSFGHAHTMRLKVIAK